MTQTTPQVPATQSQAPRKIDVLKSIINAPSVQEQFDNALKENKGPFVASIIDLYNSDANLQVCDPKQVVMEALKAAVLNLPINKALGFAYLVPYDNSVKDVATGSWTKRKVPTFQIGYKGLIQLAMRTGQYRIINADVVYEGELRSTNKLTGEIDFTGDRTSDKPVGFFAHFELINGFSKTLYMTRERVIEHAKKYSKSFNSSKSPWVTEFEAMALKTVLRNLLSHYGFLSTQMMNAIEHDMADTQDRDKVVDDQIGSKTLDMDNANFEEAQEVSEQEPQPQPASPSANGGGNAQEMQPKLSPDF